MLSPVTPSAFGVPLCSSTQLNPVSHGAQQMQANWVSPLGTRAGWRRVMGIRGSETKVSKMSTCEGRQPKDCHHRRLRHQRPEGKPGDTDDQSKGYGSGQWCSTHGPSPLAPRRHSLSDFSGVVGPRVNPMKWIYKIWIFRVLIVTQLTYCL